MKDYKYLNLLELKELAAQMPISSEAYVALRQRLFTLIAHHLVGLHRKIVVGIMGVESSVWIGDELYHLLDRSETFVPYVFSLRARTQPKEELANQKAYEAFNQNIRQKGMRLVENFDSEAQRRGPKNLLEDLPDSFNEAQLEALLSHKPYIVKARLRKEVGYLLVFHGAGFPKFPHVAQYSHLGRHFHVAEVFQILM